MSAYIKGPPQKVAAEDNSLYSYVSKDNISMSSASRKTSSVLLYQPFNPYNIHVNGSIFQDAKFSNPLNAFSPLGNSNIPFLSAAGTTSSSITNSHSGPPKP